MLRLKTSADEDKVKMQPGGEVHTFFPENLADDLVIEIHDSKGNCRGHSVVEVATIASDLSGRLRWLFIHREPEHELVGRLQLSVNFSTIPDETTPLKCRSVAETLAYDLVLEAAMKVQHFQQRNLLLHGPWKWLLTEFASYYGVSDAYTRLRYISHVMDVATPTADCLDLVYDLLSSIILEGHDTNTLSRSESHMLGEIEEQIQQLLALVFENYKSLDESTPKGLMEHFRPATGSPAPALKSAVKLFCLLHDMFSPESQLKLCSYIQAAAKKRSRNHLAETDEFVAKSGEKSSADPLALSIIYRKMKELCIEVRNEISTDIEIQNRHVLPSSIDLPSITASIYSSEFCNRLQKLLLAYPPASLSPPVADLAIQTANLQTDLNNWKLCPVKGGIDAKELFHSHIVLWIQDKRLSLLESCKLDRVKWSDVKTRNCTDPFVDEMFDRLMETVNEYKIIIRRWPEYTCVLENAVADVEMAVLDALDKQYVDALAPFKDAMLAPKKFSLNYVKKITARHPMEPQNLPEELGILLNTMKRLIDVLLPKIERELKSTSSCQPACNRSSTSGEHLSEVAVMQRAKFRNYVQAVVEKLAENTQLQRATKLKRIIQDSKDNMTASEIQNRMQPLRDQLLKTIYHLHRVFEKHLFVTICRGLWDRLGQDVLCLLEDKEIQLWCRNSRISLGILGETFASQMQSLVGKALEEEDLEPPRSIMEVRSILCKDELNHKNYY